MSRTIKDQVLEYLDKVCAEYGTCSSEYKNKPTKNDIESEVFVAFRNLLNKKQVIKYIS